MTFFGLLNRFDGCLFCCETSCATNPTPVPVYDAQGRRVYSVLSGQFVIVVEGKAGLNGLAPSGSLLPLPPDNRPGIWVQSSRPLGNGSTQVCDTGPASSGGGGIPGFDPPTFALTTSVTNGINDFACRFDPSVNAANPCTITDATREPHVLVNGSAVQFCDFVAGTSAFPTGETLLSVGLKDADGNLGPTAQIVIRVATPTPTPPF